MYKVLESYPPLHPLNSCQALHQMSLSPSCSLLIFHITLHLVNVISVYMGPSMHTGLQPMALIPKENGYPLWPQLTTNSSSARGRNSQHSGRLTGLVLSCAFMRAAFMAYPEDSVCTALWKVYWLVLVQVTTVVHLWVQHSGHVQKTALHSTLHHPPVLNLSTCSSTRPSAWELVLT